MRISRTAPFTRIVCFSFIVLSAAIVPARAATGPESIIVGDHSNPFYSIDFLSPHYGFAQKFSITSTPWNVTKVRIRLGNQGPTTIIDPIVQIRNISPLDGGPGSIVLGAFTIDGNQIPLWTFGGNNTAIVEATPDSSFNLGVGEYWLSVINPTNTNAPLVCFASASPFQQDGVGGNIANTAPTFKTYDAGQTFSNAYSGYALLMELDGNQIPEPTVGLLLIAPLLLKRIKVARHA